MDASAGPRNDPLFAIQDAHDQVLLLLDDPRIPPLDAVRWLSAHVESFRCTVHPEVLLVLDDASAFAVLHRGALCIKAILRLLERKYTGDPTLSRFDQASLSRSLLPLLLSQASRVDAVLVRLAGRLSRQEQTDLVAAYRCGLEPVPSRLSPSHPFAQRSVTSWS